MLRLRPERDILLVQSADPVVYFPMLRATSRINREFCLRQDIEYICHTGILRGFHPWHAAYNRIFILDELLGLGFEGWYLHLDADAWVNDTGFDLRAYLAGLGAGTSFVFAQGASKQAWDVNNGAFLANLAHPDTQAAIRAWRELAETISPERLRQASDWSQAPQDQQMLHAVLRRDEARLAAHIRHEPFQFFNGIKGSFVRQVLRAHQPDPQRRLDMIVLEVEAALARQGLPPEDPVVVYCQLARALGLPLLSDPAKARALMADKAALAEVVSRALRDGAAPGA
jgi:hypothetical protein